MTPRAPAVLMLLLAAAVLGAHAADSTARRFGPADATAGTGTAAAAKCANTCGDTCCQSGDTCRQLFGHYFCTPAGAVVEAVPSGGEPCGLGAPCPAGEQCVQIGYMPPFCASTSDSDAAGAGRRLMGAADCANPCGSLCCATSGINSQCHDLWGLHWCM